MQHNSSHMILLRKETRRPRSYAPPEENDLICRDIDDLCEIEIHRFNIIIEALFLRYVTICFSKAGILIDYSVNVDMF